MRSRLSFSHASATHVGRLRNENQDAFCELEDSASGRLFLFLADGVGGHRGGAVASRLAVESVQEVFEQQHELGASREEIPALVAFSFREAHLRILDRAELEPSFRGMSTTGAGLLVDDAGHGALAHVGDSRIYRVRRGTLQRMTQDHTMHTELLRQGLSPEEANRSPMRNHLSRALGVGADTAADVARFEVRCGDRFLLCSDGLWSMVPESHIEKIIRTHCPACAVRALVDLANERGGSDNITAQVLYAHRRRRMLRPGIGLTLGLAVLVLAAALAATWIWP